MFTHGQVSDGCADLPCATYIEVKVKRHPTRWSIHCEIAQNCLEKVASPSPLSFILEAGSLGSMSITNRRLITASERQ
jgi:hypothetical protein